MARGRFISKAISLDEKVDALSSDTVRLLFTWLITHLDCEGRMYGDAQTVKSVVFPRRSMNTKTIEKYLVELESHGLILRYSASDGTYLCMKNFEKHQPGLRKDRESQSQIPPPTPDLLQSNDGLNPSEVKVQVQVKVKEEVKEEENNNPSISPLSSDTENENVKNWKSFPTIEQVIGIYQEKVLLGGTVTEEMERELRGACERYSPARVRKAIMEATIHKHASWRYIIGILQNWSTESQRKSNEHIQNQTSQQ